MGVELRDAGLGARFGPALDDELVARLAPWTGQQQQAEQFE